MTRRCWAPGFAVFFSDAVAVVATEAFSMSSTKIFSSLGFVCVCLLPATVGCQTASRQPSAAKWDPEGIEAPRRDALMKEWGAEVTAWNSAAAVAGYAKTTFDDKLIRKLYSEYRLILVVPPHRKTVAVDFSAGEKERLQHRALAWKLQNMLLAMPEPAFARYGIVLGGMRQVLFLGQKYIPEIARQDYSHLVIWRAFHRDWAARTEAAYAKLFPPGS